MTVPTRQCFFTGRISDMEYHILCFVTLSNFSISAKPINQCLPRRSTIVSVHRFFASKFLQTPVSIPVPEVQPIIQTGHVKANQAIR